MVEFVNKDGFSTFELLSDSRKGTVAFDNGVGERSYTLEQMDEALPTVSKLCSRVGRSTARCIQL